MIRGVGIDLVRIERVEAAIGRFGERFLRRVLGPTELALCQGRGRLAEQVAVRFAAKEAFMKAVGLGLTGGMRWRDIEVIPDPRGKPGLKLSGQAAQASGRAVPHVSLSHEAGLAVATVILEAEAP